MWEQIRFGRNQSLYGLLEIPVDWQHGGDLIITLAGLGQAMSEKNYMFSCLRKHLSRHGKSIVQFDYRGHGDSIGELGDATISTMVEDAVEVLVAASSKCKPRRIFLVGHALGAAIAHMLAISSQEFRREIIIPILISPPLNLPPFTNIIPQDALERLALDIPVDTKFLVPGDDYYSLSDFHKEQYDYFISLGAHMLYIHGQCLSAAMLKEIDRLPFSYEYGSNRDINLGSVQRL